MLSTRATRSTTRAAALRDELVLVEIQIDSLRLLEERMKELDHALRCDVAERSFEAQLAEAERARAVAATNERQRREDALARSLSQRDDVIANLFAQHEAQGALLERAYALVRCPCPPSLTCCCCYDSPTTLDMKCARGHHVCVGCLNAQCGQLKSTLRDPISTHGVPCMCPVECDGMIPFSVLMRCETGAWLVRESHFRDAMHHVTNILAQSEGGRDDDELLRRCAFLSHDGTYGALQCASCAHGPLLTSFCDELESHHGQLLEGHVRYNNECPRCHHLHDCASELMPWNGQFQAFVA